MQAVDVSSAAVNIIGISASPTACLLRGCGRAGTQNDRLGEVVILSTGAPAPAQWTCRRPCRKGLEAMRRLAVQHVLVVCGRSTYRLPPSIMQRRGTADVQRYYYYGYILNIITAL